MRARLIYRRAFRAFVDAKQSTLDGHGDPLEDTAPYYGHLMEESQWTGAGPTDLEVIGSGCHGLAIQADGGPWLGNTDFTIELAGAKPSVGLLLGFGASSSMMGMTPLPLDLTAFGAPGCWINTSFDALALAASDSTGAARFPLPLSIPMSGLVGVEFFVQWLAADAAVTLGWTTSAGLRIVIQP